MASFTALSILLMHESDSSAQDNLLTAGSEDADGRASSPPSLHTSSSLDPAFDFFRAESCELRAATWLVK